MYDRVMRPPTREEINVYDSLDEQSAVKHFLGKSIDEAEALFREDCCYTEDLMWMGPVAFRYYINAAIQYVRSDAAARDANMVFGLAIALEFRIEYEPHELAPISLPLAEICAYVVDHSSKFELSAYEEDLPARFVALRDKFSAMST